MNPRKYYLIYAVFLVLLGFYYFIRWPVMMTDTDLWYHLSYGRYFFENKAIPNNTFFSFLTPAKEWVNYCWLFQVIVYKLFTLTGYYGIISLRTILYLSTSLLIFLYFLLPSSSDNSNNQKAAMQHLYFALISVLYFLLIIHRYNGVRPYIFSFLFIVIFLFVIEYYPKKAVFLPLLTIVWVNLHGVVYPIIFLIGMSFIIEIYIKRIKRGSTFTKDELYLLVSLVIVMWSLLINPYGLWIFGTPFRAIEDTYQYVGELRPLTLEQLFTFKVVKLSPSLFSIFNIIFIISCVAAISGLIEKRIRISHLIMFICGLLLLTKGIRFQYEFALLALPVLKSNVVLSDNIFKNRISRVLQLILAVILFIIPVMHLKSTFSHQPRYPFTFKNLPQGIATFLNHIKTGGNVLNHPNTGGYLQWMLYPDYKIAMDMELQVFTDEDFYTVINSLNNDVVLTEFINQYKPDYISVPIIYKNFNNLINKFPYYEIVFFDDAEVLYVNGVKYPDVARQYKLSAVDPFLVIGQNISNIVKEKNEENLFKELEGIIEIYPQSGLANQIITMIYNNIKKDFGKAIPYSDSLISSYPESPKGYVLKGDSLKGLYQFEESISNYEMAIERLSSESEKREIYNKIGMIYYEMKEYKKAYKYLDRSISIYEPSTTYKALYNLASSAFFVNKTREAEVALKYAYKKVPEEDKEWKEKIQKQLELLNSENKDID